MRTVCSVRAAQPLPPLGPTPLQPLTAGLPSFLSWSELGRGLRWCCCSRFDRTLRAAPGLIRGRDRAPRRGLRQLLIADLNCK